MPSRRRLLLMNTKKRIALIAHDNRKHDLLDWVRCNRGGLMHHDLFATGTTGSVLSAGLGLDISWRIVVNKHHGAIAVESVPSDTRFRVWLPVTELPVTEAKTEGSND